MGTHEMIDMKKKRTFCFIIGLREDIVQGSVVAHASSNYATTLKAVTLLDMYKQQPKMGEQASQSTKESPQTKTTTTRG